MLQGFLLHAIDVVVCAVLIRLILGWLFSYRKLIRFVFTLIILGATAAGVWHLDLPLAKFLCVILLIPTLILLVLSFLPELGRAYSAASRGNIFRLRMPHYADLVPELAGALWELMQHRRGAIVVLQRKDSVSELITGGEPVDAIVSRPLLLSIFDPHSPGHDGAAILKGNRIDVIGAVLPLPSHDQDLPTDLGTRHLASVGLSERCDADILVVSEERGTFSHASEGEIRKIPVTSVDDLKVRLNELIGDNSESEHILGQKRRSLALWVVSLVLALLGTFSIEPVTRFLVRSEETFNSAEVKVSLAGLPAHIYQEAVEPESVKVNFRAPIGLVSSTATDNMRIIINVADLPPGTRRVPLTADMIKGRPPAYMVEKFDPYEIKVTTAVAREAEMQIEPRLVGLARKFRYAVLSVSPSEFHASVRQANLKMGYLVNTVPIDLSTVKKPGIYKFETTLELPPSVRPLQPSDLEKVIVELEVAPR